MSSSLALIQKVRSLRRLRDQRREARRSTEARRKAAQARIPYNPAWETDPVLFAWEALGITCWGRQAELLQAVATKRRVAVKSGHKVGKSTSAVILALWRVVTRPRTRVIMTSSSGRQVRAILWKELRRVYHGARYKIGGKLHKVPDAGLQFDDGREIVGFATKEPEKMAGFSGPDILFIVDEASGVPEVIFDAIEGNRAGGASIVLFSNPTQTSGTFYEAFTRKRHLWHTLTVSSEETPNVEQGTIVVPGLASLEWILEKREDWGIESPIYQVRVLGNFPQQGSNAVVNLALVEASQRRWWDRLPDPDDLDDDFDELDEHEPQAQDATHQAPHPRTQPGESHEKTGGAQPPHHADELAQASPFEGHPTQPAHASTKNPGEAPTRPRKARNPNAPPSRTSNAPPLPVPQAPPVLDELALRQLGPLEFGVDPARFGEDNSVIAPRRGKRIFELRAFTGLDGVQLAGEVVRAIREMRLPGEPLPRVKVDVVGLGASCADQLRHHRGPDGRPELVLIEVNSAEAATTETCHRLRDQLWFGVTDWLKEGGELPPDDKLARDLVAPTYSFDTQSRYVVEPKRETKKRLGASPDRADAVALAIFQGEGMRVLTPQVKRPSYRFGGHSAPGRGFSPRLPHPARRPRRPRPTRLPQPPRPCLPALALNPTRPGLLERLRGGFPVEPEPRPLPAHARPPGRPPHPSPSLLPHHGPHAWKTTVNASLARSVLASLAPPPASLPSPPSPRTCAPTARSSASPTAASGASPSLPPPATPPTTSSSPPTPVLDAG